MSEDQPSLHFHLVVSVGSISFNPIRREGLIIEVDQPLNARFLLRQRDPEAKPFGSRDMYCCIEADYRCTKDDYKFVDSLINRRYEPFTGDGIILPHLLNGKERIDADRNLIDGYMLPIERFPMSVQVIHDKAFEQLQNIAWRILTLLRWNQNCDADTEPFSGAYMYWRTNQDLWHAVGFRRQISKGKSPAGLSWNPSDIEEFFILYNTDAEEPLSHHLLREAVVLSNSSPRSALLILAAALEVGVKQHISSVAPQTRWLLMKTASPPVFRLYRDAIPDIHVQLGNDLSFWPKLKPLLKICQNIFDDRNELAHAGSFRPTADSIVAYIDAASDLLYILDVLNGYEWAKTQVSAPIRKLLGWPDPRHNRLHYTMESGEA